MGDRIRLTDSSQTHSPCSVDPSRRAPSALHEGVGRCDLLLAEGPLGGRGREASAMNLLPCGSATEHHIHQRPHLPGDDQLAIPQVREDGEEQELQRLLRAIGEQRVVSSGAIGGLRPNPEKNRGDGDEDAIEDGREEEEEKLIGPTVPLALAVGV